MNLKKLHDLNHVLQASIQNEDLDGIQASLLEMMIANNEIRKLHHLEWLKKNPKAKERNGQVKKPHPPGPYTVPG